MPPPPPPPPPSPPAAMEEEEEEEEEETTDEDMDDDNRWEESEDDDNQWEESEDDDNVDEEEEGGYVDEEGHRGSAGVEEHGAEIEGWPTCCVCMEPWTSDGAHRICCIPCGHVYGRSCLEKWLRRCGNTSAKCPQCCRRFGHKHITNLHVSGDVWDDFCRLQALTKELEARVAVTDKKIEQLSVDVRSNEQNQELKELLAAAKNKLERLLVDIRSEVAEEHAKLRAEMKSRFAEADANITARMESEFQSIQQSCWEEAAQDAEALVQAEFLSMKEQMRKMADEKNATPMDLLRFMDQNGAKLWQAIRSRPPVATPACTGSMEDS